MWLDLVFTGSLYGAWISVERPRIEFGSYLKNMDREGTRVEAGRQMKRPLDGAVQVSSDGDLECRGGSGQRLGH